MEDALKVRNFSSLSPIGFSANGKWLVYTVQDNEQRKVVDPASETYARTGVSADAVGADICILNVETGKTRSLTDGKGSNWMPTWSLDGHYLAFFSDRDGTGQARLWVWDTATNALRKVSEIDVRASQIEWMPDSQRLVVTILPDGMSPDDYIKKIISVSARQEPVVNKVPGSTVSVYRASAISQSDSETSKSDPWSLNWTLRDLAIVDVVSGKAKTITEGQRIDRYVLSPDGSRIAYSSPKRFEKPGSQQILADLVALEIETGKSQVVAAEVRLYATEFTWSPSGLELSFHASGMEERTGDYYVVNVNGGGPRNVTTLSPSATAVYASSAPLWDRNGHFYFANNGAIWRASVEERKALEVARIQDRQIVKLIPQRDNLLWTTNAGESTVVLTHDDTGKQNGFYKIDLKSGESTKLLEKGECYQCESAVLPVTVSVDARHLAYFVEDAQHASEMWVSDIDFKNPRRLTHVNSQFDKYKMGSARLVEWLSDDGRKLCGALLLPSDYRDGKRYPLVVWVYGGRSLSNGFDHFGFAATGPLNMQLLAARGYAVLLPDAPQRLGTPMFDLAKTVLPGVNKIIEMGIADPNRLGVMGQSYGGYSTLSLIVQTSRFKAAIEVDGYGDLVGHYGAMDKSGTAFGISAEEGGQGLMGGSPWEFPDRYIKNSPIFFLERVETPLLIVHGSNDTTVASFLGDELFVALRRLGKEVEYARYEGEGHSPLYWSYANQLDFCNRMIGWFDKYLKTDGIRQSSPGNPVSCSASREPIISCGPYR